MIKDYQFLKESITNLLQQSKLDIGIIYFILKDIFKEIETLYYTQINKELIEESKIQNEEQEEKE